MDPAGNQTVRMKTFGFGLKAFSKYWESARSFQLVPLAAIIGTAMIGASAYSVYATLTKTDVRINRRSLYQPYETVDPEKPSKLITINQQYKKIPELEDLKKELGSFKY